MTLLGLAIRNLRNKPVRTVSLIIGFAVLSGALLGTALLTTSISAGLRHGAEKFGADAMLIPAGYGLYNEGMLLTTVPDGIYFDADVKEKVRAMRGVEAVASQIYLLSSTLECCAISDTRLIGFDPDEDLTIRPWLNANLRKQLASDEVIAGANLSSEPGGRIQLYGKVFLIAGKMDATGFQSIDSAVYIPMDGVRSMVAGSKRVKLYLPGKTISAVMIRFARGVNHDETALRIEHELPGYRVIMAGRAIQAVKDDLLRPMKIMVASGLLFGLVTMILSWVLFSVTVSERRRETALIAALGARKSDVYRIFLYEALIVTGVASISGTAIALGMLFNLKALGRYMPSVLSPETVLAYSLLVIASLVMAGALLSLCSVRRSLASCPGDALKQ